MQLGQISGAVFPASSALPCRNVLCATAASRSCCCQVPSPPAISGRGGSAASEVRMALVHQPTIRVRRRWVTGDSWELFFGTENGEKKECGKNVGKIWENWAKTLPNNRRKLFPDLQPRLSRHYTMEVAAIEEQLPRDTKNTLCKLNIVTISSISLTVHKHTGFSENQFWFKHVARSQAAELDACTVIHHNHILSKQCAYVYTSSRAINPPVTVGTDMGLRMSIWWTWRVTSVPFSNRIWPHARSTMDIHFAVDGPVNR